MFTESEVSAIIMKKHKKSAGRKVAKKGKNIGRGASEKDKSSKVRKMKRWFAAHKKKRR